MVTSKPNGARCTITDSILNLEESPLEGGFIYPAICLGQTTTHVLHTSMVLTAAWSNYPG